MTTTIRDVKEIFAKKGMHFESLPSDDLVVLKVDVVERHLSPEGESTTVLKIKCLEEGKKEASGLFVCRGKPERKRVPPPPMDIPKSSRLEPLPNRETFEFIGDSEAEEYLAYAMTHLLKDKGYEERDPVDSYHYFLKSSTGFYFTVTPRFDEMALTMGNELVELRGKYGAEHGYGLVAPAFQDSLGVPVIQQEHWVRQHGEFLAAHRIGVYTVNNKNPNQIFPCTIYPQKDRELVRYFSATTQQWPVMRDRYMEYRAKEVRGTSIIYRSTDRI